MKHMDTSDDKAIFSSEVFFYMEVIELKTEELLYIVPRGGRQSFLPYILSQIELIQPKRMIPKSNNISDIIEANKYNSIIFPIINTWYVKALEGDKLSEIYLKKFYFDNMRLTDSGTMEVN